jgi:hypothetical protein
LSNNSDDSDSHKWRFEQAFFDNIGAYFLLGIAGIPDLERGLLHLAEHVVSLVVLVLDVAGILSLLTTLVPGFLELVRDPLSLQKRYSTKADKSSVLS